MKLLRHSVAVLCAILSLEAASQITQEVDVKVKEVSPSAVRLSWTSVPRQKCGDVVTYSVYRGSSEDFEPSSETRIADDLTSPSYLAHESKGSWFYRVLATRTEGYCPPPELESGVVSVAPLDLGGDYSVTVGSKTETCHATSTAEITCPSLPPFHAVIAGQAGHSPHEFLIGCLSSDYEDGNWNCVNLTPGVYHITVHSQTVMFWNTGFRKINSRNGKDLGVITPIFSNLGTVH